MKNTQENKKNLNEKETTTNLNKAVPFNSQKELEKEENILLFSKPKTLEELDKQDIKKNE